MPATNSASPKTPWSSGVVAMAPALFDAAHAGVYWDIGSSATLSGVMLGNVLASKSITTTGVTDTCGRLLASTGDVTFAGDNTISCRRATATSEETDLHSWTEPKLQSRSEESV